MLRENGTVKQKQKNLPSKRNRKTERTEKAQPNDKRPNELELKEQTQKETADRTNQKPKESQDPVERHVK